MRPVEGEWLSVQEAADACGMAYRTMLAKVRRGEVPAEKPGKDWRLRRADVEAFIERSRVKPGEGKAAPKRVRPQLRGGLGALRSRTGRESD